MKQFILVFASIVALGSCRPTENVKEIPQSLNDVAKRVLVDSAASIRWAPTEWADTQHPNGYSMAPNYKQDSCDQEKFIFLKVDSITDLHIRWRSAACKNGQRADTVLDFSIETGLDHVRFSEKHTEDSKTLRFSSTGEVIEIGISRTTYAPVKDGKRESGTEASNVNSSYTTIYSKKGTMFREMIEDGLMIPNYAKFPGIRSEDTSGDYIGVTNRKDWSLGAYSGTYYGVYLLNRQKMSSFLQEAETKKQEVLRRLQQRYK